MLLRRRKGVAVNQLLLRHSNGCTVQRSTPTKYLELNLSKRCNGVGYSMTLAVRIKQEYIRTYSSFWVIPFDS